MNSAENNKVKINHLINVGRLTRRTQLENYSSLWSKVNNNNMKWTLELIRNFSRQAGKRQPVVVIMGPPGSGKGTISERIVRDFKLSHLAAGDVLRRQISEKTDFGNQINKLVSSGQLVPSSVLIPVIHSEIKKVINNPTTTGLLLDGFPRSVEQAQSLEGICEPDVAIQLNVPFQTIVDRLKSRWVHLPSGRVYNLEFNPPKVAGKDDVTGEALVQREDDKPEVVMERLNVYQGVMDPILDYYKTRNLLQIFTGTESNVIYPQVQKYLTKLLS